VSHRTLSFSEVSTALDCMARHDFAYGGHLAGDALKPKAIAPRLREGRAWGAAVAAYHASSPDGGRGRDAIEALDRSLDADAERQREFGVHVESEHRDMRLRLLAMLNHYVETADLFALDPEQTERELDVAIPSRSGKRASSRYRLLAYLDGVRWQDGEAWLVEFKLRRSLSSVEQIALSRQLRWYAWAWWRATGIRPIGVETVERLNEVPKPARILKSGKPSHAVNQATTVSSYLAACREHAESPRGDTVDALKARRWQQRVPIIFRPDELDEAGAELTAAAKLIQELDSGALLPLRNAKPQNCGGCAYREICTDPTSSLVDALYERVTPKRDRTYTEETVT
jgi:hypothetical protein